MGDSILSTNQRERERQIKNISRVAQGGKVEKKIYVQMEDLDEKKKRQEQVRLERENKNKRSDALKDARTPWFCQSCNKVMKKKLDNKMYRLYNHCFDRQFKFENKKNQINVKALRPKMMPRKIYANFFPMNAVSGSSFTLIEYFYCSDKDSIF